MFTACVGGPHTIHRQWFDKTQTSEKLLYSWLWFITEKGYRLKSAQDKARGLKSRRIQAQASTCPCSGHQGVPWTSFIFPAVFGDNTWEALPNGIVHLSLVRNLRACITDLRCPNSSPRSKNRPYLIKLVLPEERCTPSGMQKHSHQVQRSKAQGPSPRSQLRASPKTGLAWECAG